MKAENGKGMARSFGVTFRTTYESTVIAALDGATLEKTKSTDEGVFVRFDEVDVLTASDEFVFLPPDEFGEM